MAISGMRLMGAIKTLAPKTFSDAFRYLTVDRMTHTLQTIDYGHHEIHAGSTYRVQHNINAIPATGTGTGGEVVIAFRVPDQSKQPHILWEFVHEGSMNMKVLEGVTIATAGTNVSVKNSNRNYANNSIVQGYATGSWVSGVVTVGEQSADGIYSGGSIISQKHNYGPKNATNAGTRRNEIVLATNTNYAFILDNEETSVQGGQIRLEWYEHTPRT